MQTVTKLAAPAPADGDPATLDGWVVVSGTPSMKTWALHTSSDGSMVSGYWEATPGTYHATYTAYEFVAHDRRQDYHHAGWRHARYGFCGRCLCRRGGFQGHLGNPRNGAEAFRFQGFRPESQTKVIATPERLPGYFYAALASRCWASANKRTDFSRASMSKIGMETITSSASVWSINRSSFVLMVSGPPTTA